jgi:3-hydroxyacyl-[acyl-carrier-protein] dehydratase
MRWFWIDRFERFISGVEAVAVKNVTFAEEPLDDYLPGLPHYPHSLIIEGMAQTGGLLLSQLSDFQARIVLAKVSRATFHRLVLPGDRLRLTARLRSVQPDGAIVEGLTHIEDELQGELELTFAILDESYGESSFFEPADLLRTLRIMQLFKVGVDQQGQPLHEPAHMLAAEREQVSQYNLSPLAAVREPH